MSSSGALALAPTTSASTLPLSPISPQFRSVHGSLYNQFSSPHLLKSDNYLTWYRSLKPDAIAKGYMQYYESRDAGPAMPSLLRYGKVEWKEENPEASDKEQLAVLDENITKLKIHHEAFMVEMRRYREEKNKSCQAIKFLRNRLDKGVLDEFDSMNFKNPYDAFQHLRQFEIDAKLRQSVAKQELKRVVWEADTTSTWFVGELLRIQANVREYVNEDFNIYPDMIKHLMLELPKDKYTFVHSTYENGGKQNLSKQTFYRLVQYINLIEAGVNPKEITAGMKSRST